MLHGPTDAMRMHSLLRARPVTPVATVGTGLALLKYKRVRAV
jgi:hypothetical protein